MFQASASQKFGIQSLLFPTFSLLHSFKLWSLQLAFKSILGLPWWRNHLPMQDTCVWSLIWLDPTCHRATKLMHQNYWACALEPRSHNHGAPGLQLLKPMLPRVRALQQEKPPQWEARAPLLESSLYSLQLKKKPLQWPTSSTAKIF